MTPRAESRDWPLAVFGFGLGILLALRIALVTLLAPVGDEPYYWYWGQRLQLSYFDHPPLLAWLFSLTAPLTGMGLPGLRVLPSLALLGDLVVLWLFMRRMAPDRVPGATLVAALVLLSMPVVALFTAIAFPDHLLVFFTLLSLYFFTRFAETHVSTKTGGQPDHLALYLAAVALGLAVLSKYNGALIGVGYAAAVLLVPRYRSMLRSPHLYLAGVVSIAMQAPVLIWNMRNDWASATFHLAERWGDQSPEIDPGGLLEFFTNTVFQGLPFFFVAAVLIMIRPVHDPGLREVRAIALAVALTTLVTFGLLSLTRSVNQNWTIAGLVVLVPLAPFYFGRRWLLGLQTLAGIGFAGLLVFVLLVSPIWRAWEFRIVYGWPDVLATADQVSETRHFDFIAATRYTLVAQLGFGMGERDRPLHDLSGRPGQFRLWFDAPAHLGQTALVLAEDRFTIEPYRDMFERLELVEEIPVMHGGERLNTFRLYVGHGFAGRIEEDGTSGP